MKTHITTLNNMAGTASLAHRRVLKVAQSIGCHEMGLSFYPLKPDYAKEIDKRLDGIIAPLNYGDIVIFQYPSWIGVNYDESFVNKIKSYRDTKLIIFVQDIQKLMFDSEQAILDMEIKTLNKADLLILPSKKMHRYLKENGLDEKPVIYQTIWDMPSDICFVDHAVTRCFHFAGNYNRFPFLAEYHGKTPIYQYDANKPDRENDDSFCWKGYFEQMVQIVDVENGNRFETYTIAGEPGSGMICLNGAAARQVAVGDHVILMCYAQMTPEEAKEHHPKVVFVDDENKIARVTNYEKHGKLTEDFI